MITSMTAFARQERQGEWGALSWELRSVNHRYLDVSPRLPDDLRSIDPQVRELAGRYLQRGKVDCVLRHQPDERHAAEFSINEPLAKRLAHASREIDAFLYNSAPISSLDVLRWPGVLQSPAADLEQLQHEALSLLEEALQELVATRRREGARLGELIEQRCAGMLEQLAKIKERLPQVLAAQRERLAARLAELKAQLDPARLEQEMVLFAQRSDVAEEIDRLETHITEVRRVLKQGTGVGRRLDFLMQELNREANTIGSKSADAEVTRAAVELKVLIEQMREQVQNIE